MWGKLGQLVQDSAASYDNMQEGQMGHRTRQGSGRHLQDASRVGHWSGDGDQRAVLITTNDHCPADVLVPPSATMGQLHWALDVTIADPTNKTNLERHRGMQ